jgi:hypothetical protein
VFCPFVSKLLTEIGLVIRIREAVKKKGQIDIPSREHQCLSIIEFGRKCNALDYFEK